MKTIGIIAECNPLHKGHEYLLREAKKRSGADYVIVIMSGDFVQRGEPAVFDKEQRTKTLLSSGADLVLQLPVLYSCAAAEYFARGAVLSLGATRLVSELWFGSESGDEPLLQRNAAFLENEPAEYRRFLREYLAEGIAFPLASAKAAKACGLARDLRVNLDLRANDLLGTLYIRTIRKYGLPLKAHALPRVPAPSASGIRRELLSRRDNRGYASGAFCMSPDDFSAQLEAVLFELFSAIRAGYNTSLTDYLDVTPDTGNRIRRCFPRYTSFTGFCAALKSKDLTYTRISRVLTHILLGITKDTMKAAEDAGNIGYLRVLGMRKDASCLLSALVKSSSVPVITNASSVPELSAPFERLLAADYRAAELYRMIRRQKILSGCGKADLDCVAPLLSEYSSELVKV